MSIAFLGTTRSDLEIRSWLEEHMPQPNDAMVTVSHVSKDDATVPRGDLVNGQHRLADGRLLRVMHASARRKGDRQSQHVMAEAPAATA